MPNEKKAEWEVRNTYPAPVSVKEWSKIGTVKLCTTTPNIRPHHRKFFRWQTIESITSFVRIYSLRV
ncbi:predicted protein [Botrytis cinerea T4]|uniref:Uncharacterized protein n=1 Tax=Botryotinia fuckeliana (strain T4) TaxID=999810 RepID=G2YZ89_BOTF4|nr:predicted protein [Botrytis cinerea T4]